MDRSVPILIDEDEGLITGPNILPMTN